MILIARCILTPPVTHIFHCSSPFSTAELFEEWNTLYQYFDPLAIKRLVIVLIFVSIFSNYWMKPSRIWRILKVGVIHRGQRPRICRILHILRKPNINLYCLPLTIFVDTRLWKTKHPRKRFQNFRQSCVLLTDGIEIHQLQPLVWPSYLLYIMPSAVIGGFDPICQ